MIVIMTEVAYADPRSKSLGRGQGPLLAIRCLRAQVLLQSFWLCIHGSQKQFNKEMPGVNRPQNNKTRMLNTAPRLYMRRTMSARRETLSKMNLGVSQN